MADGTRLNAGVGGDLMFTKDTGSTRGKISRNSLALGRGGAGFEDAGTDEGDVCGAVPLPNTEGGNNATPCTATAHTAVHVGACRACKVITLTSGTALTPINDGAVNIFNVPASPGIGQVYNIQVSCATGIDVPATANGSGLLVTWAG